MLQEQWPSCFRPVLSVNSCKGRPDSARGAKIQGGCSSPFLLSMSTEGVESGRPKSPTAADQCTLFVNHVVRWLPNSAQIIRMTPVVEVLSRTSKFLIRLSIPSST